MRRASILALLSVALLAPVIAHAAPKTTAPPPACIGRDILTAMKATDPAGFAKIRAAADAVSNREAMLWRIEGKGQPASYLFGTIHSTDPRVTSLSPATVTAFASAKTVALEYIGADVSRQKMIELITAKGAFTDGNGLKDLLTPAENGVLRRTLAAEGIPAEGVHMLRPWLALFTLALPACEKKRTEAGVLFLDQRLERDGIAQGKRMVGLETVEGQIDAITGMQEPTQVWLLKATIATVPLRDDALEVLLRAYLARDIATTMPFTRHIVEKAGYDSSSLDVFEREIGTKRNYGMRDVALPLLQEGGAFIAVGALHLVGKEGLVALFREAGYTVTPVE